MTERTILTASAGKLLTNGRSVADGGIFAGRIELGEWDKPENYCEITVEEYEKIISDEQQYIL